MKHLSDFTHKYSLSKTLRFRLVPIGKTDEFISRQQFIESDERRNSESKKIKGFIDQYHKAFIQDVLSHIKLPTEKVEALYDWYAEKSDDPNRKIQIETLQKELREHIVTAFKNDGRFGNLFKAEMIKELLPDFLTDENDLYVVNRFRDFTTYFTNFQTNRKNMYSDEEKSTAIAFRIVNQNLFKLFDNHSTFTKKVTTILPAEVITNIERDFSDVLSGVRLKDFFSLDNISRTLSQNTIEAYNAVIGGRVKEGEKKAIKGVNQYINEHNQVCEKGERIPKMKPLFNQILSDRNHVSFTIEQFSSAKEAITAIKNVFAEVVLEKVELIEKLIKKMPDYNLNGIYIKVGKDTSTVSQRLFGDFNAISDAMLADWINKNPQGKSKSTSYDKKKDEYVKSLSSISLQAINNLQLGEPVQTYFMAMGEQNTASQQEICLGDRIRNAYTEFESKFHNDAQHSDEYLRTNVEVVKPLLDLVKQFLWFVKPLLGSGDEAEKDEQFYDEFMPAYELLDQEITPLYNKVRNFATKKSYSTDKIKINFENVSLLAGWDKNKESDRASIILMKEGRYYLGVFNKEDMSVREIKREWPSEGECYQKMVYKFTPDLSKMLPKCTTQLKEVKNHFEKNNDTYTLFNAGTFNRPLLITREVFELNNVTDKKSKLKKIQKSYPEKTGDYEGYRHAVRTWIRFCMDFLHAYNSTAIYNLNEIEANLDNFTSIDEFYQAVNGKLYQISFENVSASYVDSLVNEGKMYLFQIYNKDFSPNSTGKPNLHTIYWNMVFHPDNLSDVVYKLNGGAEIFFRPMSIKNTIVHKANVPIENKSGYNKQHKPHSTFSYDIAKDRRFTRNQYEFHVPIDLNFKQAKAKQFNQQALQFIKQNGIRHIIGIDRGERNLLYLVMIDTEGNIVKQMSLNEIVSNPKAPDFKQNYHTILNEKEGDRKRARQNWNTIQNIKELKEGYMSQVVHIICQLMLEYDAIVVLENLNRSFMQIRGGIEKSVYQKFEKMLIDKLGYIVDKEKPINENGGALHAVQLADTFSNFGLIKDSLVKQCGFIFYVPAWCTSKIDPTTGFVSLIKSKYENINTSKAFFEKFESIRYDENEQYFVFETDFSKFHTSSLGGKQIWNICTFGDRILTERSKEHNSMFVSTTITLTQEWIKLMEQYGINYKGNIKAQIMQRDEKPFFEALHKLLRLTLQMRNSNSQTQEDFIISPVKNSSGEFFDSRKGDARLPIDADANGAYNIARKGLMITQQLADADNAKDFKPEVNNETWLNFAQK